MNIILRQVHLLYLEGLNSMEQEVSNQQEQEIELLRLKEYKDNRDKFFRESGLGENFDPLSVSFTNAKISSLLSNSSESVMEQSHIFSNILDQVILKGKPEKFVLRIFVQNKNCKNILMKKVI